MCGRYVRRSDKQRIVDYFHTGASVFDIPPSYNIAPTTPQPIVRLDRDTGEREFVMMRWGLIPSWCKDVKLLGMSMVNANAESIMVKPIWTDIQEATLPGPRRCLLRVARGRREDQTAVRIRHERRLPVRFSLVSGSDGLHLTIYRSTHLRLSPRNRTNWQRRFTLECP
jgi:hypothetical protein